MNKKLLALGIFIVVFQLIALLLWYIFDWNLFGPMLIGALGDISFRYYSEKSNLKLNIYS
jgi:hypothetical protein